MSKSLNVSPRTVNIHTLHTLGSAPDVCSTECTYTWVVADVYLVELLCTPVAQRSPGLGSSGSGLQVVY